MSVVVVGGGRYSACCDTQQVRMTATRKLAVAAGAVAIVAAIPALGACSDSGSGPSQTQASQAPGPQAGNAKHGPMFPECGGISDQTMAEQTRVTGLVNTAKNSIGCQWLAGGGILGPHFSFTWYRGSPIGRERKTEELSRTSVADINIEGHTGFIAVGTDPTLGDNLCEVGIQFNDDFIEWSVSFAEKPFPPACDVAKELTRQSIVNSK
ncbi:putative lipoprotein LprB [Mycolicibacterium sarraceniae]|uniref:Putative lipoprotein LprB n=2 Tax=Mycolicibacterium sarraceniae TaxID=1534348 RepID=A0A7I7SRY3_9MYCO|nr:putative lipoprotein LprB [Mycolicibacterium sarraceniae]